MWEDNLWNEMKRMRRKMNRFFGQSEFPQRIYEYEPENYRHAWADFRENENSFIIALEMPGVDKQNIYLEILEDNTLVIKAEKRQEKELKQEPDIEDEKNKTIIYKHKYAKSYAGFYRSVTLPESTDANNIDAEYKNGILKIIIPKKKSIAKKKHIQIR